MGNVASGSRAARLKAVTQGMRLPLIAAPMFLVSGPDLVLAACKAGIAAAVPTPNARSLEILDAWLQQRLAAALEPALRGAIEQASAAVARELRAELPGLVRDALQAVQPAGHPSSASVR